MKGNNIRRNIKHCISSKISQEASGVAKIFGGGGGDVSYKFPKERGEVNSKKRGEGLVPQCPPSGSSLVRITWNNLTETPIEL